MRVLEHHLHVGADQGLVASVGDVDVEIGDRAANIVFGRAHLGIGELQLGRVGIGLRRGFTGLWRVQTMMMPMTTSTATSPTTMGIQLRSCVSCFAGVNRSAMLR